MGADKPKHEELYPWEEEGNKETKRVGSLPERTNIKSKVHSKPKTQGQEYLDLYLSYKEKDRLERFGDVMKRLQQQTAENWRGIRNDIRRVQRAVPREDAESSDTRAANESRTLKNAGPKHPLKSQVWDY